jgi:ATP-dependent DNA helicase RecG
MAISSSKIASEQYRTLMQLPEGHFVDLKGKAIKSANITKTVSAFANAGGGEIYVGIEEVIDAKGQTRLWRGFENIEAANGLIQAIETLTPLGNHYDAIFLSVDGAPGHVVQFTIFKSTEIIQASNGKVYVRRGAQNLPLEGEEALQRLRLDKGLVSFEDHTTDCDLEEITNSESIIDFLLQVVPTVEPEPWLRKQRLIRDERPTVSGVLLYADEPQAVPAYLTHRLRLAGCELPLFEPPAIEALFQATQGMPRKVNRLAHYALTSAAINKARTVTAEHVQAARQELAP